MDNTIIAAIITGVFSLIVGFISGYSCCLKFSKKYTQKAGKESTQIQFNGDINAK